MIETTTWLWFAAGLLVGWFHVTMLWHATNRLAAGTPLVGLSRLAVVAVLLILSARNGAILACASGWALAFGCSAIVTAAHRGIGGNVSVSRNYQTLEADENQLALACSVSKKADSS